MVIILAVVSTGSVIGIKRYNTSQNYKKHLNVASSYMSAEQYDNAITAYKEALKYTNDTNINKQIELANVLKNSKEVYDTAVKQMNDKKYLDAIETFDKVDKQDVKRYSASQKKIVECKKSYIAGNLKIANDDLKINKFDEANKYLNDILKIDANNSDAKKLRDDITRAIQKQNEEEKIKLNSAPTMFVAKATKNIDINSDLGKKINNLISNVVTSIQPSENGDITNAKSIKFGVIDIMRNNEKIIEYTHNDNTELSCRLKSSEIEQVVYKYFGIKNTSKNTVNDNGYKITYDNNYYYFSGITITDASISTLDKLIDQGNSIFVAYGTTYSYGIDYLCENIYIKTNKDFDFTKMYDMNNKQLRNLIQEYSNSFNKELKFEIIIKKVNNNYYVTNYKKL